MAAVKNIKLTNDSLTNIRLMIPLLNNRARERIADVIYGCYISEVYSGSELKTKTEQSHNPP